MACRMHDRNDPVNSGKLCIQMARSTNGTHRSLVRLADVVSPDHNSFGVIRLAMAIAVLFSHSYWFTTGSKVADPLVRWTGHSIGEHAVQVFFFLSGILVVQSLLRSRSVIDYAVGRALRIFPALMVCVLATSFVLGPLFTHDTLGQYFTDPTLSHYLVNTLFLITGSAPLPGLFVDQPLPYAVNVSLWTLKYEVLCYIGLAIFGSIALFNERSRKIATVILIAFVILIAIVEPKPLNSYTFVDNLRYFAVYFLTGVVAFLLRDKLPIHWIGAAVSGAIFVLLVGSRFGELSCCLFLGYTTLWLSTLTFGPLRKFTQENDYSYGVYIFAGPIQQLIISLLPDLGPTAVSLHALSIALPLAVFSWELVERPSMAMRRPILAWLSAHITMVNRPPIVAEQALGAPALASQRLALALSSERRATVLKSAIVVQWTGSRRAPKTYRTR